MMTKEGEVEVEPVMLENNGKCLFCKSPPVASKQVTFYSVRTLLQYLQMGEVKVPVKPEVEVDVVGQGQQDQFIDVDLQGSVVKAALCEGCGNLAETFSDLSLGMVKRLTTCLDSIQTKIKVGEENSVGMEYPVREGVIMKETLKRLQMTKPGIVSMVVSAPSDLINDELPEIVKIEEDEDVEKNATDDPTSTPINSEDNQMECSSSSQSQKEMCGEVNKDPNSSKLTRGGAMGMCSGTLTLRENAGSSQEASTSRKRKSDESSKNEKGQGQPMSKMSELMEYPIVESCIGKDAFTKQRKRGNVSRSDLEGLEHGATQGNVEINKNSQVPSQTANASTVEKMDADSFPKIKGVNKYEDDSCPAPPEDTQIGGFPQTTSDSMDIKYEFPEMTPAPMKKRRGRPPSKKVEPVPAIASSSGKAKKATDNSKQENARITRSKTLRENQSLSQEASTSMNIKSTESSQGQSKSRMPAIMEPTRDVVSSSEVVEEVTEDQSSTSNLIIKAMVSQVDTRSPQEIVESIQSTPTVTWDPFTVFPKKIYLEIFKKLDDKSDKRNFMNAHTKWYELLKDEFYYPKAKVDTRSPQEIEKRIHSTPTVTWDPFTVFPKKIYMKIFEKLDNPIDKRNFMNAHKMWYELFKDERVYFLFGEIFAKLWQMCDETEDKPKDKTKNGTKDITEDETKRQIYEDKIGLIDLRLVCRDWDQSIQNYLQLHPSFFELCTKPDIPRSFGWSSNESIEVVADMEEVIASHPYLRNPFLTRYVVIEIKCDGLFGGQWIKRNWFVDVETFLEAYGHHIWHLILCIKANFKFKPEMCIQLTRWLKLMPELKTLRLISLIMINDTDPTNLEVLSSVPQLSKLQFLQVKNVPKYFLNKLLDGVKALEKLEVFFDASCERHLPVKVPLSLAELYLTLSELDFEYLKTLNPFPFLRRLAFKMFSAPEVGETNIWPEWRMIWGVIEEKFPALEDLSLPLPLPRLENMKGAIDQTLSCRLNLERMKKLRIKFPSPGSLDFLQEMKELEELHVVWSGIDRWAENCKDLESWVRVNISDWACMQESNIWLLFPKLIKLRIVARRHTSDGEVSCTFKYLRKGQKVIRTRPRPMNV